MASEPTIGEMIAKHREIKEALERAQKAFEEEWKPYKDGMKAIENMCGVMLQQQMGSDGKANFACDDGTAYLQHGLSVKVDNRVDFLKFVIEEDHLDFLDAGVLKDPVREWLAKYEQDPPGIKTEPFIKCIIRR